MKACVLIAASVDRIGGIADALAGFATCSVTEEQRAALMATVGRFQAVIAAHGYLEHVDEADTAGAPLIRLAAAPNLAELPTLLEEALREARAKDHARAGELEPLSALTYGEYVDLVRFRATRGYLLGLMRHHRGSVTEASLTAGIARESLHRQLRRHDVDPTAFREPDAR
jgi:DNA-binding NtrC family response regulator